MTDTVGTRSFDPVALYKALFLAVVAVFVATPLLATQTATTARNSAL